MMPRPYLLSGINSNYFILCFLLLEGDKALPDGYDITYKVKEQRRVTGGLSTLVGTNEGTMVSIFY